jgi:hypothetical protein
LFEQRSIDRRRFDVQPIAAGARLQSAVAESLAQLRDVDLHDLDRGRWRVAGPQLVDQGLGRDQLATAQQQQNEQQALLRGADRDFVPVAADDERAEDSDFHASAPLTGGLPVLYRSRTPPLAAGRLLPETGRTGDRPTRRGTP